MAGRLLRRWQDVPKSFFMRKQIAGADVALYIGLETVSLVRVAMEGQVETFDEGTAQLLSGVLKGGTATGAFSIVVVDDCITGAAYEIPAPAPERSAFVWRQVPGSGDRET